jgi:hypothetical protein
MEHGRCLPLCHGRSQKHVLEWKKDELGENCDHAMRNFQRHAIQASQLTDEKNMSIMNLKVMGTLNSSKAQLLQNKLAAQAMEVFGRQSITVQAAPNV